MGITTKKKHNIKLFFILKRLIKNNQKILYYYYQTFIEQNLIKEFQRISFPNTISEKNLPLALRYAQNEKKITEFYPKIRPLLFLEILLSIIFQNMLFLTLLCISVVFYYELMEKVITRIKVHVHKAIQEYNNGDYAKALFFFRRAQRLSPMYETPINEWIVICLIHLRLFDECIKFMETHFIHNKRAMTFFTYIMKNDYEKAIEYIDKVITNKEAKYYPFIYLYPATIYLNCLKQPQKAIDYILSKPNISNQSINNKLCLLYCFLVKCYNLIGDKEHEEQYRQLVQLYNPQIFEKFKIIENSLLKLFITDEWKQEETPECNP